MPEDVAPAETTPETPEKAADPFVHLRRIVTMIERAVETNQTRLVGRALRHNAPLRGEATRELLSAAVSLYFPPEEPSRAQLLAQIELLPEQMAVGDEEAAPTVTSIAADSSPRTELLPEVEVYLGLLVLTALLRHDLLEPATGLANWLFDRVAAFNRRSLDPLSAKVYFYLSLVHEQRGELASIRSRLLATHRSACLRHDEMGQATLLNLLLRNLLHHNLVEQAHKLVSKTSFPEKASNNQFCRFLYYTGRISALQLEYGEAYTKLLQSLRKAPQNTAAGFRRTVQKLLVIVQLLMGEVPERTVFNQPEYRIALAPYFTLTQAVRAGDLMQFNAAVETHAATFRDDKTHTLVIRLSHNVIKTGLRRINVSYSRISMQDICTKLHLDSPQSAEFVCAKAIRDGVIDAVIDHNKGWMQSKELTNVYATNEPQRAFHRRINFCLNVRNEAVRAMRYPEDAYKKPAKTDELKSEEEIAKEYEEEEEEEL